MQVMRQNIQSEIYGIKSPQRTHSQRKLELQVWKCGWRVRGTFEGELFNQMAQITCHIQVHKEKNENLIVKWINEDLSRRACEATQEPAGGQGEAGGQGAAGRQETAGGQQDLSWPGPTKLILKDMRKLTLNSNQRSFLIEDFRQAIKEEWQLDDKFSIYWTDEELETYKITSRNGFIAASEEMERSKKF